MALVPEGTRADDELALLPGYEYAVVLSPLGVMDRYRYVGSAHVLDVLDGKARAGLRRVILR